MLIEEFVEKITKDISDLFDESTKLGKQYDSELKHAHKSKQDIDVEKARATFDKKLESYNKALRLSSAMRTLSDAGYF